MRVMEVLLDFENVLRLIYGCAPQSGWSLDERQPFLMSWNVYGVDDIIVY